MLIIFFVSSKCIIQFFNINFLVFRILLRSKKNHMKITTDIQDLKVSAFANQSHSKQIEWGNFLTFIDPQAFQLFI